MKKLFSFRTIMVVAFVFFYQEINAQSFALKGTIQGKDTGYVTLRYFRDGINKNVTDTAIIRRGRFQFNGSVTGSEFVQLNIDTNTISNRKINEAMFFIIPGTVTIAFKNGDADKAIIKGSKPQDEYILLKNKQGKDRNELNRLSKVIDSFKTLLKNGQLDTKTVEGKVEEINKKCRPIAISLRKGELSYIKKCPNSFVSLLLLYSYVGYLSNDSIDMMYATLSNKVKGSTLDYRFLAYNARYRRAVSSEYAFDKLKVNEKAPLFTINSSTTIDSMNIDTFRGKVVILEFWGIYCFPCLKANPYLEEMLKHHGKDKLEIIAINDNTNEELPKLISYINKNKFTEWVHVFTSEEVRQKSPLIFKGDFNNYSGLGVPRTVLIDKWGKVIYKNYGYSPEEMQSFMIVVEKAVGENIDN